MHLKSTVSIILFSILVSAIGVGCGTSSDTDLSGNPDSDSSGDDSSGGTVSDPVPTEPEPSEPAAEGEGRVWTVAEIISEERTGGAGGAAECGGEFGFKRCICAPDVPSSVRYRPAVKECSNHAAAILYDEYAEAFSVVVRDSQNRDRWPASGFNGCSADLSTSESPPNRCSAFKVQKKFEILGGAAMVHCFGASGSPNYLQTLDA